jgi:hypothetical protein
LGESVHAVKRTLQRLVWMARAMSDDEDLSDEEREVVLFWLSGVAHEHPRENTKPEEQPLA